MREETKRITSFIRDLHITHGRLYAEDQERFLPMNVVDGGKHVRVADKHALDREAARLVVENGTYIYNDPSMTINKQTSLQGKHGAPAAFIVKNPNASGFSRSPSKAAGCGMKSNSV
jgi:hypothetical protein